MKDGPAISFIASLLGDPARANMLSALMDGGALTASELAEEAGVTKQTASAHLSKLLHGELVLMEKQGRHRYFRLSGGDVAGLIENLMGVASIRGPARVRPGPKEPELRKARICYDHLAGLCGFALFDALLQDKLISYHNEKIRLEDSGRSRMSNFGIDVSALENKRRLVCRTCLDWSVRRTHLAGSLGAAILSGIIEKGWARRAENSRIIRFCGSGERSFKAFFQIAQ